MNVVVAAEAETDLERIAEQIAIESPRRALTFVKELRACCERISTFPRSFPLVSSQKYSGIRRRVHGNYLIFFRVGPDVIEIIHVLHDAMDYEKLLNP
jgi:plasmid stabilization system protein ParE